jgi:hypothetical protein
LFSGLGEDATASGDVKTTGASKSITAATPAIVAEDSVNMEAENKTQNGVVVAEPDRALGKFVMISSLVDATRTKKGKPVNDLMDVDPAAQPVVECELRSGPVGLSIAKLEDFSEKRAEGESILSGPMI